MLDKNVRRVCYKKRFAFKLAANRFWIIKANRNGLKKRDLNKCIVKQ